MRLSLPVVMGVVMRLLNGVNDHYAEGERIQDVKELVASEVVVGRQLQGGNELILEELTVLVRCVKAQGLSKLKQKVSQVVQLDESRRVGVIVCPNFSKLVIHVVVEEAAVLYLRVVVTLKDNGDEDLQEHEIHHKHVTHEVGIGVYFAATTHRLRAVSNEIAV